MLTCFLIRALTFPFAWMPYRMIHALGRALGSIAYYCLRSYRKRAWSNLALAQDLCLSREEIVRLAKESFQSLMITCLEYPKLAREGNIHRVATCLNKEVADEVRQSGKSVIFFCGHQANWEVLFLEGTARMPGVAIGRPIKNVPLYEWILSIRQKQGGKIVPPHNAIKEGLRALKKGSFLGIVGDQGMPDSGFHSPFFGRRAWSSPIPAILSHRTGCPIIVATTKRERGRYEIRYSDPIWPNADKPLEQEVERMMTEALFLLETSIRKAPGEWLWQHNRWKQQTADKIRRPYRQESICIILPPERDALDAILPHLPTFRLLYPHEFITLMSPKRCERETMLEGAERMFYTHLEDTLTADFRFKLVFNFTENKRVRAHFLKHSAFAVVCLSDLQGEGDLSARLRKLVCHAG